MACHRVFSLIVALLTGVANGKSVMFGEGSNGFEIVFVEIGDPGNPMDEVIFPHDVDVHFGGLDFRPVGGLDYHYSISMHEISRDMVSKAVEAGLADVDLDPMDRISSGPRPEMPATGIEWWEAARFVNWLNSSQGYQEAYQVEGPSGYVFWEPDDDGYDPANVLRNSLAKYVLPSTHEWHKAAYYDPSANDGYWGYAHGSDQPPTAVPSGTEPGTAVYQQSIAQGPADITEAGGLSPYGVMGMDGNVNEWEETVADFVADSPFREEFGSRGVNWHSTASGEGSSQRGFDPAGAHTLSLGFRVAMLPDAESGDFDRSGSITSSDMDFLSERVRSSTVEAIFDLNGDLTVNQQDREIWVMNLANTFFGDANLDGTVDFADFLRLSASYEQDNGWAGGDFDGSGLTDFDDFLILSENLGLGGDVASVPEPDSTMLFLVGIVACVLGLRRRFE